MTTFEPMLNVSACNTDASAPVINMTMNRQEISQILVHSGFTHFSDEDLKDFLCENAEDIMENVFKVLKTEILNQATNYAVDHGLLDGDNVPTLSDLSEDDDYAVIDD